MLGLPQKTEVNKQLPKKLIYDTFAMTAAEREKFDADFSRLTIAHELSPATLQVKDGTDIHSFFIIFVELKSRVYSEKNLIAVTKMIPQNIIFVLRYGRELQLAAVVSRFLHTPWLSEESASLKIDGLSMDSVWQNCIIQIGDIEIDAQYTLEEQITLDEKKEKLQQHIEQLEKMARRETQPRKKLELFEKIQALKKTLEGMK